MMGAKETSPPEERPRPEDDPSEQARDRTLGRASLPAGLDRVQVAARRSRHTRFTALLHHVDEAACCARFSGSGARPAPESSLGPLAQSLACALDHRRHPLL